MNKPNNYILDAKYITSWDDEESIITSKCKVNLMDRTVTDIDMEHRQIDSPYDEDVIDDNLEILDGEYVQIGDVQYPVVSSDEECTFCFTEDHVPFVRI